MRASDEGAFIELLRAVYGESYAHRELYQAGGYARFVASQRALLFGEFDALGALVGHVAFLRKDPLGDYVEQGMAFRHPNRKSGETREAQAAAYQAVIARLAAEHFFLHQNVTMQHPLAQRFARRKLGARPAGFIFDYALHQSLHAFGVRDTPMSALVMSAVLRIPTARSVLLPATRWGAWLAQVYERLSLPRDIVWTAPTDRPFAGQLECFEANPNIALMRRVVRQEVEPRTGPVGVIVGPRVDLVHVPLHRDCDVAAAFSHLLSLGYLPVAIRPHAQRPDEAVFQLLRGIPSEAIAAARLADSADLALLESWAEVARVG